MTVATTFEKLFKPHFGGLKFLVHKDLFFWKNHATYSHIGFIQVKYGNTETQRSWPFNMHSWIGSFNQKIADPIRSRGVRFGSRSDPDPQKSDLRSGSRIFPIRSLHHCTANSSFGPVNLLVNRVLNIIEYEKARRYIREVHSFTT